jgi:murein DD-endopeptidase MepM/ murein hydrolase activator NlpD
LSMNVIIVSKFWTAPRKFSLTDPKTLGVMGAVVALALLIAFGVGFASRGANAAALAEVNKLRANLAAQNTELAEAREAAQVEINALAARLAELQAQSNRLNALGERLTRIGKLEDGEFDFEIAPPLGGGDGEVGHAVPMFELTGRLDGVASELQRSGHQLELLESLMLDRDVDLNLMPSGLPVASGYASSGFGRRLHPITGLAHQHRGIDFAGPRGTPVLAVADGVVVFSGRDGGYGNKVLVDHGSGYTTLYAHNHRNLVKVGDRVRAGEQIADMGRTGSATGNHVHFEVWRNGVAVNPRQYLQRARG